MPHEYPVNVSAEHWADIIAECNDFDEPEWDGPGDEFGDDEDKDGEGD
jgi:hypothetical protein